MRSIVRPFVAFSMSLVLVAACQGSASPAASTAASAAPSEAAPSSAPSAGTSVEASVSASAGAPSSEPSAAASGPTLPSGSLGALQHQAPELEAQIPDSIAGQALIKVSFKGSSAFAGGASGPAGQQLAAALAAMGKTMDDVTIAAGTSTSVTIIAYRIAGIDGGRLLQVFQQAAAQGGSQITVTDASKGGKSVKVGTSKDSDTKLYFYSKGDILFFVTGSDDAKVTAALSALP